MIYWISWVARPVEGPGVAVAWPRGVRAWNAGALGDGRTAWCARVTASRATEVKAKIEKMYGRFASQIQWRFGPTKKPDDWWPEPNRFPR